MGFDIEDVGDSVKNVFTSKKGKIVLIGGGVLLIGAFFIMRGRSSRGGGEISFSEYPIAPTADIAAGSTGSTTTDQLAALSDTFQDSLTNMNTNFTDMINANNDNFQRQIDSINLVHSDNLVTLNENFSDQIGSLNKSVADVSAGLTDFANSRAMSIEAVQPNEYGYGFGGADYGVVGQGVKTKMVTDMQKIKSGDQAFIKSDLERTNDVIEQRKKAGLDLSAQLKHQKTLLAAAK